MDFDFNEEQTRHKISAQQFAKRELVPRASAIDTSGEIPAEIVSGLAAAGLLGLEGDRVGFVLAVEEIAAACASTARLLSTHVGLFCRTIERFGDEVLKRSLLEPASSGAIIGAVAMLDEEHLKDAPLVADRQESGGFVVRGETAPVALGQRADVFLVFAREAMNEEKDGLVALLVRRDAPGLTVKSAPMRLGLRGVPQAVLSFEGVLVAADHVLGASQAGHEMLVSAHAEARLAIAAEALGVGRAAYEKACLQVKQEQQKQAGAGLLGMQTQLADMSVELDAARLLVLRAAQMGDAGSGSTSVAEGAVGCLFATEMATRAAHKAMLLHGARGADLALGLERHLRDAHSVALSDERGETQRALIARSMLQG